MSFRKSWSASVEISRCLVLHLDREPESGDGDDLDVQLLERVEELVRLRVVGPELLEEARDLVLRDRTRLLREGHERLGLVLLQKRLRAHDSTRTDPMPRDPLRRPSPAGWACAPRRSRQNRVL